MCFDRLVIPHITERRHSPDSTSIQNFQKNLAASGNLAQSPWDDVELNRGANANMTTKALILLYDRHGSRRRMYNNSLDFVEYLEGQYHVKVDRIGPEWNALNPEAQGALYNKYPNIIAPHGAHLANLIYTRPRTRVIEIQCAIRNNAKKQTRSFWPKDNITNGVIDRDRDPEWFGMPVYQREGHTSWFTTVAKPLDMEYFVFIEIDGCRDGNGNLDRKYSPKQFQLDPIEFGEYAASRFGLKKKL
jgi:hypothetical protein